VIVLIIVIIIFVFWKRDNGGGTKKKTISGNVHKDRGQQKRKRKGKKTDPSEDRETKRDELIRELKEKRTALELLTEEYENESIPTSEFHELKEGYEKSIREIERIVGR